MKDAIRLIFKWTKKKVFFPAAGIAMFIVTGCAADQPGERQPENPFFDLRSYFTRQIERLQEIQPPVEKTVRFEGKNQTERLDTLDYGRELEVFLNADINRAAWWDKYRIDSMRNDGQLRRLRYTATDESLRVDTLTVFFEGETVSRVEIATSSEGFTADRRQKLRYDPDEGYRIETSQDITFSKPRDMMIEVSFLK